MSSERKLAESRYEHAVLLHGFLYRPAKQCDFKMGFGKSAALNLPPTLGAISLMVLAAPGHALTTVCTAAWSGNDVGWGGTTDPTLLDGASVPPCFSPPVTAQVTVGSGANAGVIFSGDAIGGAATSNFERTSPESVAVGVLGDPETTVDEELALTFSQAVANPYLFFTYTDNGTSFMFSDAFSLVQANNASRVGQVVTVAGASNGQDDGFVVQMLGTYSTIGFTYVNDSGDEQSVAFTAGATAVPGPLPLMGAGVAFGFSRRLRRRISAGS